MLKKLLLCASFLVGVYSADACAQSIVKQKITKEVSLINGHEGTRKETAKTENASANTKSHLDLNDNEVWWGYFNGNYKTNDPTYMLKMGFGAKITYGCGIKLKANNNEFNMGKGKTIEGIRFVIPDLKHIEDVKIWMTTQLSDNKDMSGCNICVQDIDKSKLIQALNSTPDNFINEIRFDTPYTIGDEDVYVGYSFRVTQVDDTFDETPVVIDKNPDNILSLDGANFWKYDNEKWYEDKCGEVLTMQVLMSGENIKKNSVDISDSFYDIPIEKNTTVKLPLTLTTYGKEGLKSFKYVITNNGKKIDEQTVTLEKPVEGVGGKYTYGFPLNFGSDHGVYPTQIEITEVNGFENESSKNKSLGDAIVVDKPATRKVFIEDYTSTQASGYAFGYVNKIKLKEIYGDNVVIVTAHYGKDDPMPAKEYSEYIKEIGMRYFPNTDIDRTYRELYPYIGSYDGEYLIYSYVDDFDKAKEQMSVATVDVSGKLSEDNNTVDVEAKVKFEFSGEKNNYALFYVLTEDGMQDDSWVQENDMYEFDGYGLEEEEPLFEPFIKASEKMTGLVYDDVIVASQGAITGIEGSISPTINIDEIQTNKISFNLSDYPIIQDKKKLNAYAVLIDTNSKKVINSCQCKVLDSTPTGISNKVADGNIAELERYTVDGRKIQKPVKGINIIKYSNGKVVKTVR